MIVIAALVAIVGVVGGPFAYIHVVEGSAPSKLRMSAVTSTDATAGPSVTLDGTWIVASGSVAGYRVGEVLFAQYNTTVGRTSDITGSIVVEGTTVSTGSFRVDLASVHSDRSQRYGQFRTRIMDTSKCPTATFTLTKSIDLGTPAASGVTKSVTADGNLPLRGTTQAVVHRALGRARPEPLGLLPAVGEACAGLLPATGAFTRATVSPTTVPSLHLGG